MQNSTEITPVRRYTWVILSIMILTKDQEIVPFVRIKQIYTCLLPFKWQYKALVLSSTCYINAVMLQTFI